MADRKTPDRGQRQTERQSTEQSPSAAGGSSKVRRKGTGKRFFSAYAQTWVGLSPLWLMAEAVLPDQKVGGTFKKGASKLSGSAGELLDALGAQGKDVVVLLDQHFKLRENLGGAAARSGEAAETDYWEESSRRAAEVIRAAGEHAIVAVSTSLDRAQGQIHESSPQLKKVISKHGREVVVLIDKSLKNPIVVTGISRFAKSKGIPYSEALLRLASMGLNKILDALPAEVETAVEGEVLTEVERRRRQEAASGSAPASPAGSGSTGSVTEIDATELERTVSEGEREEATRAGRLGLGEGGSRPRTQEAKGEGSTCLIA